jgi:hypothetical protein
MQRNTAVACHGRLGFLSHSAVTNINMWYKYLRAEAGEGVAVNAWLRNNGSSIITDYCYSLIAQFDSKQRQVIV